MHLPCPVTSARKLVDALVGVFGAHAGKRASHAKGVAFSGIFTPAQECAAHTTAWPFAARASSLVEGRFSIGGGNPGVSDKAPAVRGIAVRFTDKDRGNLEWAFISAPMFFAATPEAFTAFLEARVPDPATGKPDPAKVKDAAARHPSIVAQPKWLAENAPTACYGSTAYHSANAFFLVNAGGEKTPVRFELVPAAGVVPLTDAEKAALPDQFLADRLADRLAAGTVNFEVVAHVAGEGDSLVDSSTTWTGSTCRLVLGRLAVTALADEATARRVDDSMFTPTTLPAGIEPTRDPILAVRAAAYADSRARRRATGGCPVFSA